MAEIHEEKKNLVRCCSFNSQPNKLRNDIEILEGTDFHRNIDLKKRFRRIKNQ